MPVSVKSLTVGAALFAAVIGTQPSEAAGYPDHPVKIVVPFAAGGPTDVMARLIAQKLSEKLGQQFYVENLGGAGGNIGTVSVARAAGDGYTILIASSSYVVNPSLYKNCPYDPYKDFVPVILAAITPNILIVHPSVQAKTASSRLLRPASVPRRISPATCSRSPTTSILPLRRIKAVARQHRPSWPTKCRPRSSP